jgi:hypothetical protein
MQSAVVDHPDRFHLADMDDDRPSPPEASPLESAQHRRAARMPVIATAPPWTPALRDWLSRRG